MKLRFQVLLCLKLVLIFQTIFHVSSDEGTWSKTLMDIIERRNQMVEPLLNNDQMVLDYNYEQAFRNLPYLPIAVKNVGLDSLDGPAEKDKYPQQLRHLPPLSNAGLTLFTSKVTQRSWQESNVFFNLLKQNVQKGHYMTMLFRKANLCRQLGSLGHSLPSFTITDICSSPYQCATQSYPYGTYRNNHDAKTACTKDKKCDLRKAIPMMAGILWHAINKFLEQKLCPSLFSSSSDDVNNAMAKLVHETQLLIGYAYIMPPYFDSFSKEFIKRTVESGGLSDLDVTLKLVRVKEANFQRLAVACKETKFLEACFYSDIYTSYSLIQNVKKQRSDPPPVKDLRFNSKVKKQTMISLQRDSLQHLEILGSVRKLDKNLKASVAGFSKYFMKLAKYDEGIAKEDITFITKELAKYEKSLKNVEIKLKKGMDSLMTQMLEINLANAMEELTNLAIRLLENCNPLKLVFGGAGAGDIAAQAGRVANAATKLVKVKALTTAALNLYTDSNEFNKAFFNGKKSNKKQLKTLKSMVEKIRNGESEKIGADGADFIKKYGEYAPKTDRSSIARNNALWSAYKGAMCDLVNTEVGVAGAASQAKAFLMGTCEQLDGTLAQLFTLRESVFDFQFQMVAALARIVRGNMAKRLAANIKGAGDVLDVRKLLIGFLMTHSRLRTHASLFCDILEYKNLGKPFDACSTVDGLFIKNNLDLLIAHQDTSPPSRVERDVYIPTAPRFPGDTGYIDLSSLAENGSAIFKIPVNSSWLQHFRWTLDEENIPFVEDFKIYLPHKQNTTVEQQEHTTTRVTVTSIGGNAVSTIASNTSRVYVLPVGHSIFVTVYEEGYPSCKQEYRVPNPYGLCNNLPDICDKSSRKAGESLLPTILSSWKLNIAIQQGQRKLDWKAPKPSTNLMIRATLKLRIWPAGKRRSNLPRHVQRAKVEKPSTRNLCCDTGNKYRDLLEAPSRCKRCPDYSESKLRGVYCEINSKAV